MTSEIDSLIPTSYTINNDTYALVIGNQNYRFVPGVPYAIHDARVFKEYCEKTLGIPSENIHLVEDGTKAMINEEEFQWLENISNRENKKLIVYYAGHGVPDTKDRNKAYMLPTDVRGTKPQMVFRLTTSMVVLVTWLLSRLLYSSMLASVVLTAITRVSTRVCVVLKLLPKRVLLAKVMS